MNNQLFSPDTDWKNNKSLDKAPAIAALKQQFGIGEESYVVSASLIVDQKILA